MQFTHASRHHRAFCKKTKNESLEKTVLIIWSQIYEKGALFAEKVYLLKIFLEICY